MANNEEEFLNKIMALTRRRCGGDYKLIFNHFSYIRSHQGRLDADEQNELLKSENVGNGIARGRWVNSVIKLLDKSSDGFVSYDEFQKYVSTKSRFPT